MKTFLNEREREPAEVGTRVWIGRRAYLGSVNIQHPSFSMRLRRRNQTNAGEREDSFQMERLKNSMD